MKQLVTILVCLQALHLTFFAQQTTIGYSESEAYKPRVFPKRKKDTPKVENKQPTAGVDRILTFPVTVFDKKSELVKNLRSEEVTVFLDDQPIAIERFEVAKAPINLVLLIDASPSAYVDKEAKYGSVNVIMKDIAARLVSKLQPDDRVMVASFAQDLKFGTEFTNDSAMIAKALKKIGMRDGTALYTGLADLFDKKLSQIAFPTAVVLMTDGVDTVSRKASFESSLLTVEMSAVPVYPIYFDTFAANQKRTAALPAILAAVGNQIGPGISQEEFELGKFFLSDLTALSGSHVVLADNVIAGKTWALDILPEEIRSQYLLTVKLPSINNGSGRHNVKVRVNRPDLKVLAKATYIE